MIVIMKIKFPDSQVAYHGLNPIQQAQRGNAPTVQTERGSSVQPTLNNMQYRPMQVNPCVQFDIPVTNQRSYQIQRTQYPPQSHQNATDYNITSQNPPQASAEASPFTYSSNGTNANPNSAKTTIRKFR
jgi:hypothetical protein